VDWRVYHRINVFVSHHHGVGQVFRYVESYGTVVIAVAAVLLWLLARPDADPKWKLAAASALASGALAFLVNQVIHALWDRARPYEAHAGVYHPYSTSTDAGFPSDHSSAAFGIAVAVFLYDRLVGSLFLVGATLIAIGRVAVGAHYPLDVIAGAAVGLASAVAVVRLARPVLAFLVRLVERLTDPVVRPAWRYFSTGSSR
jgi:undecaprenyl-diphosphatase